ncbi:MAG: hypothetical protein MK110_10870 [Fuerstiella sp.]|nr:hypothetical protein [Fuerstiella sp.]
MSQRFGQKGVGHLDEETAAAPLVTMHDDGKPSGGRRIQNVREFAIR